MYIIIKSMTWKINKRKNKQQRTFDEKQWRQLYYHQLSFSQLTI